MYKLKTTLNSGDVLDFLNANADGQKLQDCLQIVDVMKEITGKEPKMWGSTIVGFGAYRYVYSSGTEGDWLAIGFSPRKANITLYIMSGFGGYTDTDSEYNEIMSKLGKFKTGKSCLYIKKLEDINLDELKKLMQKSIEYLKGTYKTDL